MTKVLCHRVGGRCDVGGNGSAETRVGVFGNGAPMLDAFRQCIVGTFDMYIDIWGIYNTLSKEAYMISTLLQHVRIHDVEPLRTRFLIS